MIDPLLGGQAKYDARKFQWIGGRSTEPSVCALWHEATGQEIRGRFEDRGDGRRVRPGFAHRDLSALAQRSCSARNSRSSPAIPAATRFRSPMERREVDGHCGLAWGSAKGRLADWLKTGKLNMIAQFALTRAPDLPNVPTAGEFAQQRDRPQGDRVSGIRRRARLADARAAGRSGRARARNCARRSRRC